MARQAREVIPDFPHHITTRGNNRRRLFSYRADYARFTSLIAQAVDRTQILLHQATLMVNHVHLIVTPLDEEALALFMKMICQPYAQYRNRRRCASGKLFEERFFSEVIRDEKHLAAATLYSDTNAFRAGRGNSPYDHPWSTCALHAGAKEITKIPPDIWTPSSWYQSLGITPMKRAHAYRGHLADYLEHPAQRSKLVEQPAKFATAVDEPYSLRLVRPDASCAREAG